MSIDANYNWVKGELKQEGDGLYVLYCSGSAKTGPIELIPRVSLNLDGPVYVLFSSKKGSSGERVGVYQNGVLENRNFWDENDSDLENELKSPSTDFSKL